MTLTEGRRGVTGAYSRWEEWTIVFLFFPVSIKFSRERKDVRWLYSVYDLLFNLRKRVLCGF